jgi:outer membrane receptor protein involved in Fe transport
MVIGVVCAVGAHAYAQQDAGSIRGVVYDDDFDVPLALAEILILETEMKTTATEEGDFVFTNVPPGRYTLVFSKDGYLRQVKADVIVSSGQLTDIDARLSGEFVEMDEFVARDIEIGGGGELGLIELRLDSPSMIDSIGAELMSRAGFSDAASALNLVSGATVQDGKYAVVRGLPDRYVSSQLNGVRLPTADEDKRAVQLDQFPAAIIESIQVSKTFTPDQQGDASGGAVNVMLKGVPEETGIKISGSLGFNSNVRDAGGDFLTYENGGVSTWGRDGGGRRQSDVLGVFDGVAGVSRGDPQTEYKFSISGGGRHEFDTGVTVGAFVSMFYERDNSFYDDGIEDEYWVVDPGDPMTPATSQGVAGEGGSITSLFDVTQGTQSVQWGSLAAAGLESEHHKLNALYLYTRIAEDKATLAEDTRGKAYFFPGYDPYDPEGVGNTPDTRDAAPYLRSETLEYTERTTESIIFNGQHTAPGEGVEVLEDMLTLLPPELDWTISRSTADMYQPDKRQFGSKWLGPSYNPGFPPWVPPSLEDPVFNQFKPDANFTLGNFQRIWKDIQEESSQYSINLTLPFSQWTESEGYLKFGVFNDDLDRQFNQDTYSNFADPIGAFAGDWEDYWSEAFPDEGHVISDGPPFVDVDYDGEQKIHAWYFMTDFPITSQFKLIGGVRYESTDLSIVNYPEENSLWYPPGALTGVKLNPGDADVDFTQNDTLPSFGFVFDLIDSVTLRGSYSKTIARQTFKELTPIIQQEFLGGPIFIGNPDLQMSSLRNLDLRLDYTPYEGALISMSWFRKDVTDAIEYVQRSGTFTFTTPVNYPKGQLTGLEVEVRQNLGEYWESLSGLSVGANATFISSEVTLPEDEAAEFEAPNVAAPMPTRHMTNAPEYLYNLYLTYDLEATDTQFGVFYTVKGDTLVSGATTVDGVFVPNVYAREFGTLNLSVSQKLGEHFKLTFRVKNLLDPSYEEVYRSQYIGDDVLKSSYSKGVDFSIGLSASFTF